MVNLIRKMNQVCTYWHQTGSDKFGAGTFDTAVQLKCRWEDGGELFINKSGQEITSKSKVFFAEDISLEGYLELGTDHIGNETPYGTSGAFEIQMVKRTPDLRNMTTLYVAFL